MRLVYASILLVYLPKEYQFTKLVLEDGHLKTNELVILTVRKIL